MPFSIHTLITHCKYSYRQEIISKEIIDETDQYQDNQSKQRARRTKNAAVMRGLVITPGYTDLRLIQEQNCRVSYASEVVSATTVAGTKRYQRGRR